VIEPGKYDITIYQGATFELNLQLLDGNNSPVVMSGYTVAGKLFDRFGVTQLATFTQSWTAIESGMFKMSIPPNTTATLSGAAQYDFLVTEPSGTKYYLLQGAAAIEEGLTGRA
jgi:hypothetical protein